MLTVDFMLNLQPDLSGALFVIAIVKSSTDDLTSFAMTKKRERKAEIAAQIILIHIYL